MMPQLVLDNLWPWVAQISILGLIAALLPAILRIRHPRSHLIYCHSVLVVCLALPMVQPWRHRTIVVGPVVAPQAAPVPSVPMAPQGSVFPWGAALAWLIVSGAAVRLSWTALGLWRIRCHRIASAPLHPLPESIQEMSSRLGVNATFCISPGGIGPVTFGFLNPVVLLPETFLSMDASAQRGIVCHELLHIKRRDWLITLLEEIVAAAFWFHPAFWWLLGQTRLSREQIVDAEVVRVISDREPYINALLAIAGVRPELDLAPASLFLRRRHLLQRMHSLLSEVSMSRFRLVSSYASIAVVLAAVVWAGTVSFPLKGLAEIKRAPAPVIAPVAVPPQNSPGYVVNIRPLSYPADAIQKKIEGTVAVELTFNADGRITDSRVLSGPDELRASALESALRGNYGINVARTLQVLVDFKLADAPQAGQRGGGRSVTAVPPPPAAPPSPAPPFRNANANAVVESFDIRGLSDPQLSDLRQRVKGLEGQPAGQALSQIGQAIRDSGITTNYAVVPAAGLNGNIDDKVRIMLMFGNPPGTTIHTPFGDLVTARIATPFGDVQAPGVPTIPPISKVDPVYPPLALQARIQGVVVLDALINNEGRVENMRVVTGHPLLVQTAFEAVKQWVFPTQTTPTRTSVVVNFQLPQ
jgi:TonB family protein